MADSHGCIREGIPDSAVSKGFQVATPGSEVEFHNINIQRLSAVDFDTLMLNMAAIL